MKKIIIILAIAALGIYPAYADVTEAVGAPGEMSDVTTTAASLEAAPAPLRLAERPVSLRVWVTAYASVPEETDDTPFITASNTHVHDGVLAANFLPFGTKVRIPALFGEKIFTVEDRMSIRKKNIVDVWMPTKQDAVDFGAHRAEIVFMP